MDRKVNSLTESEKFAYMIKQSLDYLDKAIQQSVKINHQDTAWLNSVLADTRGNLRILKAEADSVHNHEIRKSKQIADKATKTAQSTGKKKRGRPKKEISE